MVRRSACLHFAYPRALTSAQYTLCDWLAVPNVAEGTFAAANAAYLGGEVREDASPFCPPTSTSGGGVPCHISAVSWSREGRAQHRFHWTMWLESHVVFTRNDFQVI